ncbi:MAG: restriction endonuclease subunit S [Phycisphaerales bacterium]
MSGAWASVPLGECLAKNEDWVRLDQTAEYREVTVRLWGRGVVLRGITTGAEIASASRIRVRSGQFILSRIDARNGASGVIPPELDGAVVTGDFPAFNVRGDRLLPEFLGWMAKTQTFVDKCIASSEGTTNRVRLKEDRFLAATIPLPPLAEQRRIVARLDALAAKIVEAKSLIDGRSRSLRRAVIAMACRDDLDESSKRRAGWRRMPLSDVIALVSDAVEVQVDKQYPNVGMLSYARGLFPKEPISGMDTSASRLYRIREGQFIYSRLFAFEGAYGRVSREFDGHFVSNEYPTFECRADLVNADFLWAHFSRSSTWTAVAAGSLGLGDRRQRVQPHQILTHVAWIPPLSVQRSIAAAIAKEIAVSAETRKQVAEIEALVPSIVDRAFTGAL